MMIKRTTLNRVIDALAFVGFVLVATTGFLLHVLLPPGSGRLYGIGTGYRAAGKSVTLLWGLTRHDWGTIHFWVAVGLMVVLAIHLGLHRRWIACSLRGRPREGSGLRAALGLIGLVILLAIAVTPWLSPIARVTRAQHLAPSPPADSLAPHQESMTPSARGIMTLRELEAVTGVPVAHVIAQLGLPSTVSPDERLGRLHQRYGVTLHDIRRIIVTYPR